MRSQASPSTRSMIWIFGLVIAQFHTASAFTQCYYPDGSIPADYLWEPCTGSQFSSCCVPTEGDICQENGLCYYPPNGDLYRGTCTDRTWDDPACNSDICVSGYETTWNWVVECDVSGSSSWACGNITDDDRETATCAGSAKTLAISLQTVTTTSSVGRYTSPPPIDTSLYSVYTSSYTTIITADAQTTTLTSLFASTFTSTLSQTTSLSASATNATASNTSAPASESGTKRVGLTMGVIVAIIVGPTLALVIGLGIFFFLRRRARNDAGIRLNSSPHPPPNGPVGADQVNPYEMDVYESSNPPRKKYEYSSPKVDAHEVNGLQEEKTWGRPTATEIGGDELRSPRSPAPMYTEAVVPVELDGTPSFRGRSER